MDFQNAPATAFPRLLKLAVGQTLVHSVSFESYLLLCEFVQQVLFTRQRAIKLITSIAPSNQDGIARLIERLRIGDCNLDHHGAVFGLYILGAYREASELVEETFQTRNGSLRDEINEITSRPHISAAKDLLDETLEDYFAKGETKGTVSTRIKRPGSLFAKLISTGALDLGRIIEIDRHDLSENLMPYDLVGAEITVNTSSMELFGEFTEALVAQFASRDMPLTNQNVYSSDWMGRKSFEGKISIDGNGVPFQLHVWDQKARRYEWLSYGNYKMNKLFYPLIMNWERYLDSDLGNLEYAALAVSNLSHRVDNSDLVRTSQL